MPTAKSHQPSVTFAVDLSLEFLYDLLAIQFESIITTQHIDMTQLCYCNSVV